VRHDKIRFGDMNISKDATGIAQPRSRQVGVPILDIAGNIVVGFDKEKINELLQIKDIL
jgi:glutaredoxin 3